MTSPFLNRPGAVAAGAPDEGVAAHYSDPVTEQRAMERSAAWVDRSNRDVVRVSGPDRLSWLHTLTSQHLEKLEPGTATEALRLDANGRVHDHLYLVDDGSAVWAHVEPGAGASVVEFLDKMRFLYQVEVEDLSPDFAVISVVGPERDAVVKAAGLDSAIALRGPAAIDLLLPRTDLVASAERLGEAGAATAGMWAYEAWRIASHHPRHGLDTDDRTIAHETGWSETAVHLNKGCYPGQETIAKIHNVGRPPRRLVLLHLDGSAERLPERGSPVMLGDKTVGFVGTSARHHELGPIALGLVKRNVDVDAEFVVDDIAAAQEVIVSPDTGANAEINFKRARL
ncbi:folate-binding protein YgfZ [Spiractinospora alimapuensis]|uniref:CAF17-like 4Fe-4S cluster assembly/insertion protein YgfZ n=1 Tax=Spiractinospora alimapuensis TaxID=2820884 RepID=UPI001F44BF86|nr:glycine cleavage T C-terminal barrel domain-containing protein [Spiractinospora alimapuensis]QVQ50783.1 folate-binding protein YgfZ [Spiractinospora alimapuensis]